MLGSVFNLSLPVAERIMLKIHDDGSAIVALCGEERAKDLAASANSLAASQSMPLRIAVRRATHLDRIEA